MNIKHPNSLKIDFIFSYLQKNPEFDQDLLVLCFGSIRVILK